MGVHGPLRQPRGAGGVHDVELVGAGGADLRRGGRGLVLELRVVPREGVPGIGRADVDPLADVAAVRAAPLKVGHLILELAAVDQDAGRRVLQDERQFVRHQPPVQRHVDRPELGHRKEALDVLGAVHQQQRHAVALPDAERLEQVRGAVGAGVELPVGEAAPGLELHPALQVGREVGALREDQADIALHGAILSQARCPRPRRSRPSAPASADGRANFIDPAVRCQPHPRALARSAASARVRALQKPRPESYPS